MKCLWPLLLTPIITHASPLDEARVALDNGFPQVALVKIEQQIPSIGSNGTDAEANLLYARALIEAGQSEAASAIITSSGIPSGPARDFWLAQGLAANGDWLKASQGYASAARASDFEFQKEAVIGLARMLKILGKLEEAASALTPATGWPTAPIKSSALLDLAEIQLDQKKPSAARAYLEIIPVDNATQKARKNLLLAKAAAQEGNDELVLSLLTSFVPVSADMAVSATTIRATALQRLLRSSEAETLLEEFIAAHPTAPGLNKVFASLDEIYSGATSPSSSELKRWSSDPEPSLRQKLATYYLARFEARLESPDNALILLERLASDPASNPLAQETLFELAALRIRFNRNDEALSLLPPAGSSPHTDFLRGLALSRKGEHAAASAAFTSAAFNSDLSESALFNAAICQLFAGITPNTALAELERTFPSSLRIPAFRMQEAFHLARQGDPQTESTLQTLTKSPVPGVASRARLALAEWKYQQLDYKGADAELRLVSTQTEPAREAALKVFLTDDGNPASTEKAIAAARTFLAAYQNTDPEASVRMKLGEVLYRKGDFAAARVEFESLARKFPNSEYNEPALFLAAQSVSRIPSSTAPNDAILLFEEVASGNGPLASEARLEQASLIAAQGKPLEANLVLEKILSSNPPSDTRASVLIEKGKNLYSLGDKDPANYRAAIEVWKQIAAEHPNNPSWRNEALTRIGIALEKTGDLNIAVATYYDVFKPTPEGPNEFFWFYNAGFAAARILESTQKWTEAIRVYEILAANHGPRSLEAKNRINQLRLEHFLWEGE
jgi:TolA-binding protein